MALRQGASVRAAAEVSGASIGTTAALRKHLKLQMSNGG